jgi:Domain of unknown function (DUF892)
MHLRSQINERAAAMEISNFKNMYLAELQELVSVEGQLSDALLRMAAAASHPALKRLLLHHRAETETQKERLVTILRKHGASPTAHTDYECELDGAGALLGRHRLCGIRRVQIQRSVRADRQQYHADKTANAGKQVTSGVELRRFHFAPRSIALVAPK